MTLKFLTLRNYLFILVALLILMLAVSQILLLHYFKTNFNAEVDSKASQLSEHLVELAVDELDFDEKVQDKNFHMVKSKNDNNNNANVEIKWLEEHSENTQHYDKKPNKIKIYQIEEDDVNSDNHANDAMQTAAKITLVDKKHIRQQLKTVVKKLKANKQLKGGEQPHVIEYNFEQKYTDSLTPLIYKIQLAIVLTTLVALAFAFWLSNKFNKPLQELSKGFKHLAQGHYSYQVTESGVDEIRQTIKQFNMMTQRLKALTELETKHQEIEHLAELGEVSRGLAHALRTPIHTLGLLTDKLKTSEGEQQLAIISQLNDKIYSLDRYIKALLTLTSKGIDRTQTIRIIDVIQDIRLELLSAMPCTFNVEVNCENTLCLLGDETEIRNIIHTLMSNAVASHTQAKATQPLLITVNQQNEYVCFTLEDYGMGLSDAIKAQLFKPHVSSKADGAGMGLYIAQRIIRLHYQGNIELYNSKEHQGCVAKAHFYLPSEK